MNHFIQLHMLTSYPPSNPNRDDLGRPKTAIMGGTQRMRISSQSLKRAWRTSDIFEDALTGYKGIRSKEMGVQIRKAILSGKPLEEHIKEPDLDIKESEKDKKALSDATERAFEIARAFVDKIGKDQDEEQDKAVETDDENENETPETETKEKKTEKKGGKKSKKSNLDKTTLKSEQIVFYTPEDIVNIQSLINKKTPPTEEDLKSVISNNCSGADVAMFGRMLANAPGKNIEAAVQVAHAITVHTVAVEDDYFTAVDDLNRGDVDSGSAHLGEAEFSAGLFYTYICINKNLLIDNLDGKKELAEKSIGALIEAAAKIAPSGKQNSFANRVRTSYILAEKGDDQPRSLSVAFLKPVSEKDFLKESIERLNSTIDNMDIVFCICPAEDKKQGDFKCKCKNQRKKMCVDKKEGSLQEIINFAKE